MQFIAIIALSLASLSVTSANILDSLLGGGGGGGGWGEQSPSAVNCNVQTGSLLNVNAIAHNDCSTSGNGASGIVNCGVQNGPISVNLLSSNDCHLRR
ncbi:hypothetical protein PCANC_28841 [Puccinia coronata f. sp. avenae]|uniref:Hydrophobin n=2 Tax=Puccinia coronata f. sp. avenae TaxID=200324 RepID=A0A2N5RV95_9BASI|nr:hypothetical protein PCANC_28841 [Puccinia coronata f. sp. avenae]